MILTDYFTVQNQAQWPLFKQLGINHATIRLPEDKDFDLMDIGHWRAYTDRFFALGIRPTVVEPMPNILHDLIKTGAPGAQQAVEKAKTVIAHMGELGIGTLCMNFMAHVGWLRTSRNVPLRGGALGTGFRLSEYEPREDAAITTQELWENLEAFVREVVPVAEKYGVRLALHPDDPPVPQLGHVARILTSYENIHRAVHLVQSDCLGVTLCQGCYSAMGEDVYDVIRRFAGEGKLFFVHFRDVRGNARDFIETFHDDGQTDMARAIRTYRDCGYHGPVRVDHVPTLWGEDNSLPGYGSLGRLYAIGYLKGLLEGAGYAYS